MHLEHSFHERLIGIENLTLKYGSKTILNNVSGEILNVVRPGKQQGQVVALLGPSGCGKTQLLRCIAGLNTPTSGKVLLRDSQVPVKSGEVGVVQQAYPLLNHRTILGNLMMSKSATKEKALEMLVRFGLLDKRNSYPVELSGGQRQRVAIMQQLLMDNHFLLMDEPFSGLDILAKNNVANVIMKVTSIHEDNTVVFTTHDIDVAVSLSEIIWVMGQTKDAEGNNLGANIIKSYNLIDRCIAWHPLGETLSKRNALVEEIKELFPTLV